MVLRSFLSWGSHRCDPRALLPAALLAFVAAFVACGGSPPIAPVTPATLPDQAYVDYLVALARHKGLAQDKRWLRLGHYRSTTFGGWESEADGLAFFVSPDGKTDPGAELEATLRGFFAPGPDSDSAGLQHPMCRFPARLLWLHEQLQIDFTRLQRRPCGRFQDFYDKLQPRSIALIFSSYYLNSPASAFGHTFLRVNKRWKRGQTERQELLDYGVDFSATVDTNNSLVYGIKGLFGLFPGVYHKLPYYYKVREYNDFESRDLWAYELNLDQRQVDMVVAHLWELGSTHFNYYYLTENCSYHVLGSLEVADPNLELLRHLGWPVIPSDTVKALYRNPGLVRNVTYRPSNRAQYRRRVHGLNADEQEWLAMIMGDATAPFPEGVRPEQQVRVLDAALDLADFKFAEDLVKDHEETPGGRFKQALLERRAATLLMSDDVDVEPPRDKMPHVGHDSARLGLGSGWASDDGAYHTLSYRLALHDLGDPSRGYPETAQIEFLPIRFRYYVQEATPWLEDFSILRAISLNPMTRFDKSMSWSVRAGGERIRDEGCDACFAGLAEVGYGVTTSWLDDGLTIFAQGQIRLMGLGPFDGGIADLPLRAGVGPWGGVRIRWSDEIVTLATGHWHYMPTQTPWSSWRVEASTRAEVQLDWALGVTAIGQPSDYALQGMSYLYF